MGAEMALIITARNQAQAALNSLRGGLDDIKKEARSVSDQMRKMGDGLKNVGGKLTAGVTLPILGMGGAALKIAGDFEQTKIALTTMLGSGEKATQLFNEMREFSASTPFEFPQIAEAGKMLLAFGISSEKVIPKLRQLGDIASGVGIPVNDLTLIYGQASVAGRVMTGDLNQLVGRGVPIISALAKTMGVAESQVRKLAEEGKISFADFDKAIGSLTTNGGQFAGMMDAQSQSLLGLFSTFKDNITLTLADVGQVLIDTFDLKGKLAGLNEFLSGLSAKIADFAKNNPEMFKFAAIVTGIAAIAGPLAIGLGWVMTQMAALGPIVGVLGAAFSLLMGPLSLVVLGIGALLYFDIGGLGTKVTELAGSFGTLWSYFKLVVEDGDYLNDFLVDLPGWMQPGVEAIGHFAAGLQSLPEYFKLVAEDGDYLNDFLADMPTWMQPGVELIGKLTAKIAELREKFSGISLDWPTIEATIKDEIIVPVGEKLSNIDWSTATITFITLKNWLSGKIDSIDWTAATATFTTFRDWAAGKLNAIDWTAATATLVGFKDWASEKLENIDWSSITTVFGGVATIADGLNTSLQNLTGDTGGLTQLRDLITGTVERIAQSIAGIDQEQVATAGFAFGGAISSILNVFTTMSNLGNENLGVATASLSSFIQSIMSLAESFVSGLDAEALSKSAGEFVGSFLSKITTALQNADLPGIAESASALLSGITGKFSELMTGEGPSVIGEKFGELVTTILTQLSTTLSNPEFGQKMGESFANILSGIVGGLAGVINGFNQASGNNLDEGLSNGISSFVSNFISGVGTGLENADFTGLAGSLITGLVKSLTKGWSEEGSSVFGAQTGGGPSWGDLFSSDYWSGSMVGKDPQVTVVPTVAQKLTTADLVATGSTVGKDPVVKIIPTVTEKYSDDSLSSAQKFPGWESLIKFPPITFPGWETWIKFPNITFPGWNTWIKFPSISWPGWDRWISFPDIPDFPGWESLWSWITSQGSVPPINAIGTSNWRGGFTSVGETGPEIIYAPRGSQIFSPQESMELAGGGGMTINVNAIVADGLDLNQLAYQLVDIISRRRR